MPVPPLPAKVVTVSQPLRVARTRHDAVSPTPYDPAMTQPRDTADSGGERLARLLRNAREDRGWTQDQLVEAARDVMRQQGIDAPTLGRQTIVRYESGRAARPAPQELRAVCIALGVDPREAAIALGYLTREDVDQPPSDAALEAQIRDYMDYMRRRRAGGAG